jgi:hypothetical protein
MLLIPQQRVWGQEQHAVSELAGGLQGLMLLAALYPHS